MLKLLEIFLTFLKIGAVSFGGGYGMIPVITDEVLSHGWLTQSQIMNFIAVSESTPGPIAINMATFIGGEQGYAIFGSVLGRFLGSLFATIGVVLPSFIIILLIVSVLKLLLKYAGVKSVLTGIRPVVIGLITSTGLLMAISVILSFNVIGDSVSFSWKALTIFLINVVVYFVYKKIKKKNVSSILLILISAGLGMLLYGVF